MLWGGSALERGHAAPLEHLAQLGDAFGGVGAVTRPVEAAELVAAQAAKGREECQCAVTQKQTLWGVAAHLSEVTALPLSPSHS